MPINVEILDARSLLEAAERQRDPELKAAALEEGLLSLESLDPAEMSQEELALVSNLKKSHARSLLLQFPSLLTVPFLVWYAYFRIMIKLKFEVEALIVEDANLRENHIRFITLWRQELLDALKADNGL